MITKVYRKTSFSQSLVLGLVGVSGGLSLAYQVLWQRYLANLLGSDSQSSSLIVSLFLLGLSLGYFVFSRFNFSGKDRSTTLQYYGVVELLIALWAHYSPSLLTGLYDIVNPQSFAGDIIFAFAFIIPPTFCMGASLPMLTSLLPRKQNEIHRIHFLIYGINTLGASLGVLVSFMLLLKPYPISDILRYAGVTNFALGALLIMIPLRGVNVSNVSTCLRERSDLHPFFLHAVAFFSGMLIIALEIFSFRLVGLAMGSSVFIFPLVLFFFVFYTGLSSARLKEISDDQLLTTIWRGGFGMAFFFVFMPIFPKWVNSFRVIFIDEDITFFIFHFIIFLMLGSVFYFLLYPLGRLLPVTFGLLSPSGTDSTKKVGVIYGLNTVGTLFGGVIVGHYLLNFLNIPDIIRIMGIVLMFMGLWAADRLYDTFSKILFIVFIVIFAVRPFGRYYHEAGLFRTREYNEKSHFKGMFKPPKEESVFFNDGPHATVAVKEYNYNYMLNQTGRSIFVNGKSDSSTTGDYATVVLLGLYPYLYAKREKLNVGVIGLGTGMTVGTLLSLSDVESVHLAEISPKVIEASKVFRDNHLFTMDHPRLHVHQTDAFRFFKRTKERFDFIISEPSNPWTAGVELLYTEYFYHQAAKALTDEGEFVQWMHTYSMDKKSLTTIFYNLTKVFPYAEILRTQSGDIMVRASKRPLIREMNYNRMLGPKTTKLLRHMGVYKARYLPLLMDMTSVELPYTVFYNKRYSHTLETLMLGARSYISFYKGDSSKVYGLRDGYISRFLHGMDTTLPDLLEAALKDETFETSPCILRGTAGPSQDIYCRIIHDRVKQLQILKNPQSDPNAALKAYNALRDRGMVLEDKKFLERQFEKLMGMEKSPQLYGAYKRYHEALMKDGKFKTANEKLAMISAVTKLTRYQIKHLRNILIEKHTYRKTQLKVFSKYGTKLGP